jgi:methylmalonyl-CoA mutase
MGAARPLSLADDFPDQTEAAWLRLVEKTLKGAALDSLVHATSDGIEIRPLYGPEPSAFPPLGPGAKPGRDGNWDIRTLCQAPNAAEANGQLLADLNGGAASALVVVESGQGEGVTLRDASDLAQVLDGVFIDMAPVALDAGFLGPFASDWLAKAAKAAPLAPLAFHLDPLGAFARTGLSRGPLTAHLASAAQAAARHRATYLKASLFLASGRVVHEAGGSDAQELAFMTAAAVAYARAGVEAGLTLQAALEGVVLGASIDAEYFTGIAKLRAIRLLWDQLTNAFGVEAPAVIEARSSRRMLSKMDCATNLIRLTVANFAAAVGGADVIVLDAFTQPFGAPDDLARRQARNIQLVLMEEAHLARVQDPSRGAWFIEDYSRKLARAAWRQFQDIEGRGGLARAIIDGSIAESVAAARSHRRAAFEAKAAKLVGVNLHPNAADVPPPPVVSKPAGIERAPDAGHEGADDHCPALSPIRWSEPFEGAAT